MSHWPGGIENWWAQVSFWQTDTSPIIISVGQMTKDEIWRRVRCCLTQERNGLGIAAASSSIWVAVGLTFFSGALYLWRNRELYLQDL